MPAKINLLGQTFGKLIVIEETSQRKNKSVVWKCKCLCGEEIFLSTKELRSDGVCQCLKCGHSRNPKKINVSSIVGNKYNKLKVIEATEQRSGGKILYKCQCDCGNITLVSKTDLESGHTKSCGCIQRKYQVGEVVNNRTIMNYNGKKQSHKSYYKVKCNFCGREYETLSSTLQRTISCGCQRSLGEYYISKLLQEHNIPFQKEYKIPNYNYRYDFALFDEKQNLFRLIEFDGEQHFSNNIKQSGWNTVEKYQYTHKNDQEKNAIAKKLKIPLVRIPYWERENITLSVLLGNKFLVE